MSNGRTHRRHRLLLRLSYCAQLSALSRWRSSAQCKCHRLCTESHTARIIVRRQSGELKQQQFCKYKAVNVVKFSNWSGLSLLDGVALPFASDLSSFFLQLFFFLQLGEKRKKKIERKINKRHTESSRVERSYATKVDDHEMENFLSTRLTFLSNKRDHTRQQASPVNHTTMRKFATSQSISLTHSSMNRSRKKKHSSPSSRYKCPIDPTMTINNGSTRELICIFQQTYFIFNSH